MKTIDGVDLEILKILQSNVDISLSDLAEKVHLTTTPCWKRLKKLEDNHLIEKKVALLNPDLMGFKLIAFVQFKTNNHSFNFSQLLSEVSTELPEVMEFYRMAGDYDYMMKVLVKDMKGFDDFYKKLINRFDSLTNVTSSFAMETLKYSTELPI